MPRISREMSCNPVACQAIITMSAITGVVVDNRGFYATLGSSYHSEECHWIPGIESPGTEGVSADLLLPRQPAEACARSSVGAARA